MGAEVLEFEEDGVELVGGGRGEALEEELEGLLGVDVGEELLEEGLHEGRNVYKVGRV